jgi:hypothetical protein
MNKKTKMWLGVGAVAAVAYYFWNKSKTTKAYANQMGNYSQGLYDPNMQASNCYGHNISCPDGKTYCIAFGQPWECPKSATKPAVAVTQTKTVTVAKPQKR